MYNELLKSDNIYFVKHGPFLGRIGFKIDQLENKLVINLFPDNERVVLGGNEIKKLYTKKGRIRIPTKQITIVGSHPYKGFEADIFEQSGPLSVSAKLTNTDKTINVPIKNIFFNLTSIYINKLNTEELPSLQTQDELIYSPEIVSAGIQETFPIETEESIFVPSFEQQQFKTLKPTTGKKLDKHTILDYITFNLSDIFTLLNINISEETISHSSKQIHDKIIKEPLLKSYDFYNICQLKLFLIVFVFYYINSSYNIELNKIEPNKNIYNYTDINNLLVILINEKYIEECIQLFDNKDMSHILHSLSRSISSIQDVFIKTFSNIITLSPNFLKDKYQGILKKSSKLFKKHNIDKSSMKLSTDKYKDFRYVRSPKYSFLLKRIHKKNVPSYISKLPPIKYLSINKKSSSIDPTKRIKTSVKHYFDLPSSLHKQTLYKHDIQINFLKNFIVTNRKNKLMEQLRTVEDEEQKKLLTLILNNIDKLPLDETEIHTILDYYIRTDNTMTKNYIKEMLSLSGFIKRKLVEINFIVSSIISDIIVKRLDTLMHIEKKNKNTELIKLYLKIKHNLIKLLTMSEDDFQEFRDKNLQTKDSKKYIYINEIRNLRNLFYSTLNTFLNKSISTNKKHILNTEDETIINNLNKLELNTSLSNKSMSMKDAYEDIINKTKKLNLEDTFSKVIASMK